MLAHKIGVASTFIVTISIMLGAAIATSKMARLASQHGKKDMYRFSRHYKVGSVSEHNKNAHSKQATIHEPSSAGTVEDRSRRCLCLGAGGRVGNSWGSDLSLSVVRNFLRNIRTLRHRGLRNSSQCSVDWDRVGGSDSLRDRGGNLGLGRRLRNGGVQRRSRCGSNNASGYLRDRGRNSLFGLCRLLLRNSRRSRGCNRNLGSLRSRDSDRDRHHRHDRDRDSSGDNLGADTLGRLSAGDVHSHSDLSDGRSRCQFGATGARLSDEVSGHGGHRSRNDGHSWSSGSSDVSASGVRENQSAGGIDLGAAALLSVTAWNCNGENDLSGHRSRSRSDIGEAGNRNASDLARSRSTDVSASGVR
jgi:hypothetical protein